MKRLFAVLLALAFLIQPVLAKAAPLPEAEIENSEGYIVRMSADTDLPSAVKTGCEPIGNGLFYAPTLKDLMELAARSGNFGRNRKQSDVAATTVMNRRLSLSVLQKRGLKNWKAAQKHAVLRPFAWLYQSGRYIKKGISRFNICSFAA